MLTNLMIPNWLLLVMFVVSFGLFFWGIYKATRTKEFVYSLAFLPLFILLTVMFII